MAKKKTKKVIAKPIVKKKKVYVLSRDVNFIALRGRVQVLEQRLDKIVDALSRSKKVKGL